MEQAREYRKNLATHISLSVYRGNDQLTVCGNPWPNSDISDGDAIAYDISSSVLSQLAIQSAVETMRLVDVAVDGILEFLGSVAWGIHERQHPYKISSNLRVK